MPDFPPALDGRSLVVAHRGASEREPENTLAAFQAALDVGADAIELDVRLSADGVPVVMHDADVSRSTGGTGLVHELTLADLKRLDASGGSDGHAEIPTVAEALELIGTSTGTGVMLEIKNLPGEEAFDSPREAILEGTVGVLQDSRFLAPVVVASFNWLTIERCREIAPGVATGFITIGAIDPRAALDYARSAGHEIVLPQVVALLDAGSEFVAEAHRHGIRVGTWTADDEETLTTLFSWGVDAVASNRPDLAVSIRNRLTV
ncbi:MAG: glycerophosphodiester phosphodiesterase [Actinomycetota bacterium]